MPCEPRRAFLGQSAGKPVKNGFPGYMILMESGRHRIENNGGTEK